MPRRDRSALMLAVAVECSSGDRRAGRPAARQRAKQHQQIYLGAHGALSPPVSQRVIETGRLIWVAPLETAASVPRGDNRVAAR